MFVPEGYVSLVHAIEWVVRMREPEAVAVLTPDGFAFFARINADLFAVPASHETADQLRRWDEARQKLSDAGEYTHADLRRALISNTVVAVAVREDGALITMQAAEWRRGFLRRRITLYAPAGYDVGQPEWLEPFAEAMKGRTVAVGDIIKDVPTAFGYPIIARADLAAWCGFPPEPEPIERPADWPVARAPSAQSRKTRVASTRGAETRLEEWLAQKMRASPSQPPGKENIKAEAEKAGHLVSVRAFLRAYANAVKMTGAFEWSASGRKSKRRIDTAA